MDQKKQKQRLHEIATRICEIQATLQKIPISAPPPLPTVTMTRPLVIQPNYFKAKAEQKPAPNSGTAVNPFSPEYKRPVQTLAVPPPPSTLSAAYKEVQKELPGLLPEEEIAKAAENYKQTVAQAVSTYGSNITKGMRPVEQLRTALQGLQTMKRPSGQQKKQIETLEKQIAQLDKKSQPPARFGGVELFKQLAANDAAVSNYNTYISSVAPSLGMDVNTLLVPDLKNYRMPLDLQQLSTIMALRSAMKAAAARTSNPETARRITEMMALLTKKYDLKGGRRTHRRPRQSRRLSKPSLPRVSQALSF